jgi:hypothetical protein
MPSEVNIGGPTSKSTWARLRSPLWSGTGYKGIYPDSKNWGKTTIPNAEGGGFAGNYYKHRRYFNYGYKEPLTPLLRAFPVDPGSDEGSFVFQIVSMSLGIRQRAIQWPVTSNYIGGGEFEAGPYDSTNPIVEYYLTLGESLYRRPEYWSENLSPYQMDEVLQGYGVYMAGPGPGRGYDYNSVKETLLGAVVNLTLSPGPVGTGIAPQTINVTITEDLFPENMQWNQNDNGVFIGQYVWPSYLESAWPTGYDDNSWPSDGWKINSITLRS